MNALIFKAIALIFVLDPYDHTPPNFPQFYVRYPSRAECEERMAELRGADRQPPVIAVCRDASDKAFIPYLKDSQELIPKNVGRGV